MQTIVGLVSCPSVNGFFTRRTLQATLLIFLWVAVGSVAPVLGYRVPAYAETGDADDIIFGMSTALSGPAAELGQNMLAGVRACFERMNRQGGIKGRSLRLLALDDRYEPRRTAPNMRRLLIDETVLAVIGNVGTPTATAAVPIAIDQKTLFFGAYTGAGFLRKTPPDRYVINYRASYAEEVGAMVDALVDIAGVGVDEIAFFTQRDSFGDAGFAGGIAALQRHGLTDLKTVVHTRYERNTLAVESSVAEILLTQPEPRAIIMVGTYKPCAKFIKTLRNCDVNPLFLNVSFVGSTPLAMLLSGEDVSVIVTQVVPHPKGTAPLVRAFQEDLRQIDENKQPTFGALEGYVVSRILVDALLTIQGEITRENIIDAMEKLGEFDVGLNTPLYLSRLQHQACHRVWPTIYKDAAFHPMEWVQLKDMIAKSVAP